MSDRKLELIDKNALLKNIAYLMPQENDELLKMKKLYSFIVNEIENQPTIYLKGISDDKNALEYKNAEEDNI